MPFIKKNYAIGSWNIYEDVHHTEDLIEVGREECEKILIHHRIHIFGYSLFTHKTTKPFALFSISLLFSLIKKADNFFFLLTALLLLFAVLMELTTTTTIMEKRSPSVNSNESNNKNIIKLTANERNFPSDWRHNRNNWQSTDTINILPEPDQ